MEFQNVRHSIEEKITPLYIGEKERIMAAAGGALFILAGIKGFRETPFYATLRIVGGACLIAVGAIGYLPLVKAAENESGMQNDKSEPDGL